jgi:hypothetical protein
MIRMALGGAEAAPGVQFEEARGEGWIGELLEKLGGKTRFEELPVPAGFQGTLRPYQVRGFSWLGFLRQYGLGACLADDMGLGKTIQALALFCHERSQRRQPPGASGVSHFGCRKLAERGRAFRSQAFPCWFTTGWRAPAARNSWKRPGATPSSSPLTRWCIAISKF